MGQFDKILEFIENCTLEELTEELQRYGIKFEEKRVENNSTAKFAYQECFFDVVSRRPNNDSLLRYYAAVPENKQYCTLPKNNVNFGSNKFEILQMKDAA